MEQMNLLWDDGDDDDMMEAIETLMNAADEMFSSSSSSSGSDSSSESEDTEAQVDFVNILDSYSPMVFKAHMRIMPSTAIYLIDRFSSSTYIPENCNGGKERVNAKKSIYMYIWYISNTITYRQLAVLFNVCKSTAWLVVQRVTSFLISIGHEFIKWPEGAELINIQSKFKEKKRIPGIIGAIDCTHINVKVPKIKQGSYTDRKHDYSLVLQAVVDHEKKFTDICCGEAGSLHDFRVLRRSELYRLAETDVEALFPNNTFIIGDSAYPSSRWIVSPYKDYGNLTEAQKRFNFIHSSTRMVVENAFGLLKTRFRRLLKFTEQTNLVLVVNLIVSACIMHNICISMDDLHENLSDPEIVPQNNVELEPENIEFLEGATRRDILFNYLLSENII